VEETIEVSLKERGLVVRAATKQEVVGSIPVTTEFFLISCDSNQVPKWFGTHYNLEVPSHYNISKMVL